MSESSATRRQAEFDLIADEYYAQHAANIAVTGEAPEYFAEYKVADIARFTQGKPSAAVLDFGCGIGNSVPHLRTHFPAAQRTYADVSKRSIEISQTRFSAVTGEHYVLVGEGVPVPDASQDIVFSACVFHHIPHEEHAQWLAELRRILRPGGILAIFEHNPLNPLTVRAVNTCPFDANARLIRASVLRNRVRDAGFAAPGICYRLFFPAKLAVLRGLEPHLDWCALGAQYRVTAAKP